MTSNKPSEGAIDMANRAAMQLCINLATEPQLTIAEWERRAAAIVLRETDLPKLIEALMKISTEPDYTDPESMVRLARSALREAGVKI